MCVVVTPVMSAATAAAAMRLTSAINAGSNSCRSAKNRSTRPRNSGEAANNSGTSAPYIRDRAAANFARSCQVSTRRLISRHPLGYSAAMSEPLDEIDRILARELVADGRATLAHLAATAGCRCRRSSHGCAGWSRAGVVTGYSARINPEAVGHMLSAFVAITPLDPSQPDDAPARLEHIEAIESCHSVAGEESYVLLVRVESARALEDLLQQIRTAANVRTRSTIILQTFYAGRDSHTVIVPVRWSLDRKKVVKMAS